MPYPTILFLAALGLGLILELWLLQRHRAHILMHRERVPDAFANRVSPEEHRKAADYSGAKIALHRIDLLISALVLLAWTLGGGIERLNAPWAATPWGELAAGIGLIISFSLINGLIGLPSQIYQTFVIEERFGFNRTTPARFFKDLLLQTLLGLLLGIPLLGAILWLMGAAGTYWWLAAWGVWIAFMLFISWIFPTVLAPLFNKFTPLEQGPLRERVEGLLERCGFASKGIFVMDGSRRSGHGNAYFTGFGRNKRIVFYDTLIESLDGDEVEAVLAHELGHFKKRHVLKGLLSAAAITLAGLWVLGWLSTEAWFYQSLGVSEASNAAALLLFMLAAPVFTQFFQPLGAWYSRHHEFEADEFAVRVADAEPLISALVKMYRENASTLTPDPLYSAFHDSHPPAPVRIAHLSSTIS
ncbi:MAG: peptidase M48 [Candidatus Sedimenticola endophacoides]|uniref:Peptidase M48 n=1 Tax=Candidatus Sedimenticola endophacoides TaxID=2548426 RepID=A0A6N4E7I4_9GAMM|nr:MAG: peptidase M48 [Candidatus Sedimenticola endophacoides]OQX42602.1 MAG: peptidase M48 [Candidatus Sedimenticola endophacoides]OQX48297.1 MAG: peptidase M48 [Candidatus Sedimenticola endophacoides]PUD98712.1 MAG: peptidase M48 [Candidatus Sedimenticola endophacoides]PUE01980.1 MAG: peptidase M48 [Candidatus Sedimenticola endophacoides]